MLKANAARLVLNLKATILYAYVHDRKFLIPFPFSEKKFELSMILLCLGLLLFSSYFGSCYYYITLSRRI